jgi:ATP-binding cassette subfamily B protein
MKDEKQMNNPPKRGFGGGPQHLQRPVEKAKDFKGTLKRLVGYIGHQKNSIIVVSIFAILGTIFAIVSPKIMGKATTKLFEGIIDKMTLSKLYEAKAAIEPLATNPQSATKELLGNLQGINQRITEIMSTTGGKVDFDYIWNIILILILLYLASALFNFVQQYIMAGVSQGIVKRMREDVFSKFDKLPLKFYDSKTHGEILSRVTNDIDNISSTLAQSLTQLISAVVTIVGVVIMMLTISPILTLVALVTIPMSMMITMFVAKKSQKYFKEQQKYLGELNGHVEEMYTGYAIVKAYNYEYKSISRFEKFNDNLRDVGLKAQFISGIIMPMMNFVNNIGYVLITSIGGYMIIKKSIEIGDVQAFIQYSRQLGQPIVQTANIANIIQSTIASSERVFEILDEIDEIEQDIENVNEDKIKGNVKFDNITFGYNEDKIIIDNLTFEVEHGQKIAIVGPTGAGKTTLVNLLMRFYDTNLGNIYIDEIDSKLMKRSSLRNLFGMVLQDTWLFKGTIKENIAYSKEDATMEQIKQAAITAHAHHFISTLPDGYETILNEEGTNISQGQKQLLTIARAILANPKLLILDEATSNVDTRTEVLIQKAMDELMKGRTSFIIAHRLSTIKNADLILVMKDGRIIETGNHNKLLDKKGFYFELYNSQFES